jgi:flagellin
LAANAGTLQITINGVDVGTVTNLGTADQNEAAIETLVNANSAATGVAASDATGALVFTAADGRNISITATNTAVGGSDVDDFGMGGFTSGTLATTKATVTLSSTDTIVVDDDVDGGGNVLAGDATTTKALTGTAISLIDISSASGASTAITSIDAALSTISATRSDLGSYQSRFESIVANSQTSAENLSASRSRIMDADFAQETAQLTKSQILQQSGIAMLAQANSIPQNVLALLQ